MFSIKLSTLTKLLILFVTTPLAIRGDLFEFKKPYISEQGFFKNPNVPGSGSDMPFPDRVDYLEKRANNSDPQIYYLLWWLYTNAPNDFQSSDKAQAYLQKAVELDYPRAHSQLGVSLIFNNNGKPDYQSANRHFETALKLGDLNASFALAEIAMEGVLGQPDHKRAFDYYQIAAALDNSEAHFKLGNLYALGLGCDKSIELATDHWHKASKLGSIDADFNLGANYFAGAMNERTQGLHHLTKAAKVGHIPSIDLLGWFLLDESLAWGAELDNVFSVLSEIPDKQNLSVACYIHLFELRKRLYKRFHEKFDLTSAERDLYATSPLLQYEVGFHMYFQGYERDLGMSFLEMAAESGIPEAQFIIARIILNNSGINKVSNEPIAFLTSAAEAGHFLANRTLGDLFYEGDKIDRNYNIALSYYKRGAELGDTYCINKLGDIYQFGRGGVAPDQELAIECFKKTSSSENAKGVYRLALLHPNDPDSKELYRKAVELGLDEAKDDYIQHVWEHGGNRDEIIRACAYGISQNTNNTGVTLHGLLYNSLKPSEQEEVEMMPYNGFLKASGVSQCGGLELVALIGRYELPAIFRLNVLEDMTIYGAYFYIKHKKPLQLKGYLSGDFLMMDETYQGVKTGHIRLNLKNPFLSSWNTPDQTESESLYIVHYEPCEYEQFFELTYLHSFDKTHTIEMFDGSEPRFWEVTDRVDFFRFAAMPFTGESYLSMNITGSNAHGGLFNGLLKGWNWGLAKLSYDFPECNVQVSIPSDDSFLIVEDDCSICCGARASLRGYYPKTEVHAFALTDLSLDD